MHAEVPQVIVTICDSGSLIHYMEHKGSAASGQAAVRDQGMRNGRGGTGWMRGKLVSTCCWGRTPTAPAALSHVAALSRDRAQGTGHRAQGTGLGTPPLFSGSKVASQLPFSSGSQGADWTSCIRRQVAYDRTLITEVLRQRRSV
jgi:hypothetical protein